MSIRKTRISAIALAASALVGAATVTGPATASATATGAPASCPSGWVCIYPGPSDSGTPVKFLEIGPHNVYNLYGKHRIWNNQTNGAIVRTCTGSNGTGCQGVLDANHYYDKVMDPINSLLLATHA